MWLIPSLVSPCTFSWARLCHKDGAVRFVEAVDESNKQILKQSIQMEILNKKYEKVKNKQNKTAKTTTTKKKDQKNYCF